MKWSSLPNLSNLAMVFDNIQFNFFTAIHTTVNLSLGKQDCFKRTIKRPSLPKIVEFIHSV